MLNIWENLLGLPVAEDWISQLFSSVGDISVFHIMWNLMGEEEIKFYCTKFTFVAYDEKHGKEILNLFL
ncbi:hypothetical protein H8959_020600 [Pygathrix nigripes]